MEIISIKFFVFVIAEIVIFTVLALAIVELLGKWLYIPGMTDTSSNSFYSQKKDTIDVLFIGNCHCYSTFRPSKIKEKTGLNSYVFACPNLNSQGSYYYFKTALKTQHPKYAIIETFPFNIYDSYVEESTILPYTYSCAMDLPIVERIKYALDTRKSDKFGYWTDYIFGLSEFHDNWTENNLFMMTQTSMDNGFVKCPHDDPLDKPDELVNVLETNETEILDAEYLDYFYKIIQLAKEENIELIFVEVPYLSMHESEAKRNNYLREEAEKNGYRFLNLVDNDLLNELNFTRDCMMDYDHVNLKGAEILTTYLAKYIETNY